MNENDKFADIELTAAALSSIAGVKVVVVMAAKSIPDQPITLY